MTTSELKTAIAKSKYAKKINEITVVFEFPYLNYKNEVKGLSAIYQFVQNHIHAFKEPKFRKINDYIQPSIYYYTRISDLISNFDFNSEHIDVRDIDVLEEGLKDNISTYRKSPLLSDCPEIEVLLLISNKYPNGLDAAYNYIIGANINLHSRDNFIGYSLAFNLTNKENTDIARIDLNKKVISESNRFFKQYITESESQLSEFLSDATIKYNEYINELQNFKEDKQSRFNNWFEESNNNFSSFFEESTVKIKTLENTYEEQLRLKKPAEYWKQRAIDLKKQGWRSLYWLIAMVAFTAIMLFVLLWLTPDDMLVTIFSEDKSKAIRWSIVFLAFLSVLIYGIRTLNKVTFSSFHLARDAEEREQLTYVYLSLINEKAMDKEDRLLIMQSLFSRADTGLLKEDSSPSMPGAANVVEKLVK